MQNETSEQPRDPDASGSSESAGSQFSVLEIREWLEGWKCTYGDGSPAPSLSLESVLTLLKCDQDGIEAWRTRKRKTAAECTVKYFELLHAVESKHSGESRHETALRYIREREDRNGDAASANGGGEPR